MTLSQTDHLPESFALYRHKYMHHFFVWIYFNSNGIDIFPIA